MKTLQQLLQGIRYNGIQGNADRSVSCLILDSRKAMSDALFFAIKGAVVDGHDFIEQVIDKGATVIVCEKLPEFLHSQVTYVLVEEVKNVIGEMASSFYDNPSADIKVIGVTGTNGKTTIATLLFQLFSALGYTCGLISTVANHIGETVVPATHTTPDAISLQELFARMKQANCSHVFMEVSSHAVDQNRIGGVQFDIAVFTNITRDHLDYHNTFDAYIKAKKVFFDRLDASAIALTNLDDKRGMVMLQNTKATKKTYAVQHPADYKTKVLENEIDGLLLLVNKHEVHCRMNGLFNAYNITAVFAVADLLGEDPIATLAILSNIKGAPGRFETIRSNKERLLGVIDYAHTPDALLNVLATIKQFSEGKKVITVVGCGGDRDKGKRPIMAQVAAEYSDKVILTSDNPRTENPEFILNDMEAGISPSQKRKVFRIVDRKAAIQLAVELAGAGDIILIAGKGHENYQEINGIKNHFDDKEVFSEMLQLLEK